ncbi:MAG: ribosome-associated translation inhibitor RaiA [Clostridia bacterium]|nr:ribosome-associated translation inhibitor RaiA [Clostridia bacterium]
MKITITTRKTFVNEIDKGMIEKKIGKLAKFFSDDAEATVTVSSQKNDKIVEVTIFANGLVYRAEERNEDILDAVDRAEVAIDRQIRRNKTRLEKNLRREALAPVVEEAPVEEEKEFNIIRTKTYSLKPMSAEEAILQMNLLGHEFFIFLNAETDSTDIVYKRKDGNYGLIETRL